jgi:hypothetical protein
MTAEQMAVLGKSKEQVKAELLKKNEMASKNFIQAQMQDSYNIGYADGFKEAMDSFGVNEKELASFKTQIRG